MFPEQCEDLARPPAAFWLLLITFVAALAFFARLFLRRFFGGGPPPLPGAPPAPPTLLLSLFKWLLRYDPDNSDGGLLNLAQVEHLAAGATPGVQQALAFFLLILVVMATDPVARILYALFVCRGRITFRPEGLLVTLYYAGASLLLGATEARIFAATNWVCRRVCCVRPRDGHYIRVCGAHRRLRSRRGGVGHLAGWADDAPRLCRLQLFRGLRATASAFCLPDCRPQRRRVGHLAGRAGENKMGGVREAHGPRALPLSWERGWAKALLFRPNY